MSETNTTAESTATGTTDETLQTGAEPGSQTGTQAEPAKSFTQADVDRIVKERLDRAEAKATEKAQKAAREAEEKALAEQGKYKELYEKAEAEKAAQAAELSKIQRQQLATSVAAKVGLPATLAGRLQGDSEEELEADAKALLESLPKPQAPNLNSNPGGNPPNKGSWSEQEAQELAARYGVSAQYWPTNQAR